MAIAEITRLSPRDIPPHREFGDSLETLLRQLVSRTAVQRCYWAHEIDTFAMSNGSTFAWIVSAWDSMVEWEKFHESPEDIDFRHKLDALSKDGTISHGVLRFREPIQDTLVGAAPHLTEIIAAYFPSNYSDGDQQAFDDGMEQLFAALEEGCDEFKSGQGAWVADVVQKPGETEQARAYFCLNAWTSSEAHLETRKTKLFADNIHHLRNAKDLQGLLVVHARFSSI